MILNGPSSEQDSQAPGEVYVAQVMFDHLIKLVPARILHCEVNYFSSSSVLWEVIKAEVEWKQVVLICTTPIFKKLISSL